MTGPTQSSDFSALTAFQCRWCSRTRKLTLCDHQGHSPSGSRLLALLWLAAVAYCAERIGSERGWTALGICATAYFAGIGLVALTSVHDATLDFAKGKYRRRRGLWPFLLCRRGSLDDIKAVRICTETRFVYSRVAGPGKYEVTVAYLQWKDSAVKPLCLTEGRSGHGSYKPEPDAADVEADARVLGGLLGIPVVRSD